MSRQFWVFLGMVFVLIGKNGSASLSARAVMEKNEDVRKLSDVTSEATLSTGSGSVVKTTKQFTWWRKLTGDQVHNNTLTRFHLPAEVRDEGVLFLENKSGDNEVMLYLPNFKKIRRMETSEQSGSFMASEFSYSDIATPHVDDYTYKSLSEESCPSQENHGKCFVLESIPANDTVRDRTGYSKSKLWVAQDNFMLIQAEYFDLEGNLIKRMQASKITEVDTVKHKWMANFVRMENKKSGRYTELQFTQVKANMGIPDSKFSQQELQRAR